jgi:hypothetical protein
LAQEGRVATRYQRGEDEIKMSRDGKKTSRILKADQGGGSRRMIKEDQGATLASSK